MYNFDKNAYEAQAKAVLDLLPVIEKTCDEINLTDYENILLLGVGGTYLEWQSVAACIHHKTNSLTALSHFPRILSCQKIDCNTERSIDYRLYCVVN